MNKPTQKPSPTIATLHNSHTLTCDSSPSIKNIHVPSLFPMSPNNYTPPRRIQKAVESRPGVFKVSFPDSVKRQDYPGPKMGKS